MYTKICHMKKCFLLCCLSVCLISVAQAQQTPPKDSTLKQFVGTYKFPDGSVVTEITVAIEDTSLTMSSSVGTTLLEKKGEDLYLIVQYQGTAKFNRDANKKVIGVSIDAMGYQLEGTKTDAVALMNKLKFPAIASKPSLLVRAR